MREDEENNEDEENDGENERIKTFIMIMPSSAMSFFLHTVLAITII